MPCCTRGSSPPRRGCGRGTSATAASPLGTADRKSTRLNSSPANISTLALHDALPIFSRREDAITVACTSWLILGLFVDGWAHNHQKPESFFTPWHALLYSGFLATAAWLWSRYERHRGVPVGYGRSEEHTSELQSRQHLDSCPTRRSSDLLPPGGRHHGGVHELADPRAVRGRVGPQPPEAGVVLHPVACPAVLGVPRHRGVAVVAVRAPPRRPRWVRQIGRAHV